MNIRRAFTMIELLTVVATIAVLAAIAVPNFLEAQVRSKLSRTVSDMAVVSASLQAYFADYNAYPPNNPELREFLLASRDLSEINKHTLPTPTTATVSWTSDDPKAEHDRPEYRLRSGVDETSPTFPILLSSARDLNVLTTPVAYLTGRMPDDTFTQHHNGSATPACGFLYVNLSDLETTPSLEKHADSQGRRYLLLSFGPDYMLSATNPAKGTTLAYDPTNGTISPGDIFELR